MSKVNETITQISHHVEELLVAAFERGWQAHNRYTEQAPQEQIDIHAFERARMRTDMVDELGRRLGVKKEPNDIYREEPPHEQ